MRILIAEDDPISRRLLATHLTQWGYDPIVTCNGNEAWRVLRQADSPQLAILDWMMPGMGGLDVCRSVRNKKSSPYIYIVLLTAKERKEDIAEGLDAGADDYVTKPFHSRELRARVRVGKRLLDLQNTLARNVEKLEEALSKVKQLHGLLPICAYCKKIRDDQNYWQQVEGYIASHSEVKFSHGICPDCFEKFVRTEIEKAYHESETVE
ncbi:MAG: response regulator transcription factor [bacterium]